MTERKTDTETHIHVGFFGAAFATFMIFCIILAILIIWKVSWGTEIMQGAGGYIFFLSVLAVVGVLTYRIVFQRDNPGVKTILSSIALPFLAVMSFFLFVVAGSFEGGAEVSEANSLVENVTANMQGLGPAMAYCLLVAACVTGIIYAILGKDK